MDTLRTDFYHDSRLSARVDQTKHGLDTAAGEDEKLRRACRDFEALFTKQLLDSMRGNIPKGSLLPRTPARELYEDMLYDAYAKEMAATGELGLGRTLYRQMSAITAGERIHGEWRGGAEDGGTE